jgi:hypothetical protein
MQKKYFFFCCYVDIEADDIREREREKIYHNCWDSHYYSFYILLDPTRSLGIRRNSDPCFKNIVPLNK